MSLYVGNLPHDFRTQELEDLFYPYGELRCCEVKRGRGFGFIEYFDVRDAEMATKELDNKTVLGASIRVEYSYRPNRGIFSYLSS